MDVYVRDPDRILLNTTTGSVQAWKPNGPAIVVSFDLLPRSGEHGCHAYYSHFMTAADARSLADALTRAAEHAERLTTPVSPGAAADLGCEVLS